MLFVRGDGVILVSPPMRTISSCFCKFSLPKSHFVRFFRTMISLKLLCSTPRVCPRLSLEPFKRNMSALPGSLEDTYYRTEEGNPATHNTSHLGRIYTVDPEVPKLFGKELNPKENYYANNYFAPRQWSDR